MRQSPYFFSALKSQSVNYRKICFTSDSFEKNVLHLLSRADGLNYVKGRKNNSIY